MQLDDRPGEASVPVPKAASRNSRLSGAGLMFLWVAGLVLVGILTGPKVSLVVLFAAGPLIACAFLPPAATAAAAAMAVVFTAVFGGWHHRWHTEQQVLQTVDVLLIGAIAVGVAVVRGRRERLFTRLVEAEADARRAADAAGAQFSAAFDRAPVGVALVDADRTIVRANPALAELTGLGPGDLVGMSCEDLSVGRPGEAAPPAADPAGTSASVDRREIQILAAGGQARWVACSVARVDGIAGVHAVEHVEDIHDRKVYEERLQFLADRDALTGLFNRRRFYEELRRQSALERRYGGRSTVMLLDLDGFKYVNDTLGHATGDRLMQVIAAKMSGRLRESDVLARLGGDEFGILLAGAPVEQAEAVAESLLDSVRHAELRHRGQRVRCTASIGMVGTDAAGSDVGDLMADADLAMYAAKDSGRDTYVAYDPEGTHATQSRSRLCWIDRIRSAIEHGSFALHVQPILDLSSGAITGGELLIRMRDEDGLISPDRFLHIAERHGLAPAIDRFVITHGMRLAAEQDFPADFRWEINLSADSLGDPDIPALIEATLTETGLDPASVVFEITETTAIANMDNSQAFAARITAMGCEFALDDFGAGYGSFYWLKHLPASYVKIDGEFIRQLTTSGVDRVIVQAVVDAARKLGKQTIAEYVTDSATLDLLRELRVDHAQGYHIGRPEELGTQDFVPLGRDPEPV